MNSNEREEKFAPQWIQYQAGAPVISRLKYTTRRTPPPPPATSTPSPTSQEQVDAEYPPTPKKQHPPWYTHNHFFFDLLPSPLA